jgi:translation initiation factor IF-2
MNKTIHAKPPIIVKELAEQIGISRFQMIHDLAGMNVFVRVDQSIKPEVATFICEKYGYTLTILQ